MIPPFSASGLVGLLGVEVVILAPGRALGSITFLPWSWYVSHLVFDVYSASWFTPPLAGQAGVPCCGACFVVDMGTQNTVEVYLGAAGAC